MHFFSFVLVNAYTLLVNHNTQVRWLLRSKLYKLNLGKTFLRIEYLEHQTQMGLNFGKNICIFILSHLLDCRLYLLNGFDFYH